MDNNNNNAFHIVTHRNIMKIKYIRQYCTIFNHFTL